MCTRINKIIIGIALNENILGHLLFDFTLGAYYYIVGRYFFESREKFKFVVGIREYDWFPKQFIKALASI